MHFLWITSALLLPVAAFEWHVSGNRPSVDRRAIAGLWRLTTMRQRPMKEFTVYPKKPKKQSDEPKEVLLMLKEDGSFLRYQSDDDKDVDGSWKDFMTAIQEKKQWSEHILKGIWDFRDGKLILAADRIDETTAKQRSFDEPNRQLLMEAQDTILEGRVVATYEQQLAGNPSTSTIPAETEGDLASTHGKSDAVRASATQGKVNERSKRLSSSHAVDAHLSVPVGSVKVGKFFYPKNHPSFFDQPIFKPVKRDSFTLRQILGSLNTAIQREEDELVEKFRVRDFHNKTFLLTSSPIGQRPKGRQRWSIKYNTFVNDPVKGQGDEEELSSPGADIRVMQVQFHPNNTFSTVAGLGDSTILRGKFDVIGQNRDQLWMQVWRFGFGRSVSGSVYSEGKMLTQDDAKTYWGTIDFEAAEQKKEAGEDDVKLPTFKEESQVEGSKRIEVKGSVMFGWGLEPMPVARFIMREVSELELQLEEEEEDDDEEENDTEVPNVGDVQNNIHEDGIDWEDDGSDSFFQ